VFLVTTGCSRWSLVEGVIWALHQRVLTEHGSHLYFWSRGRWEYVSEGDKVRNRIFEVR